MERNSYSSQPNGFLRGGNVWQGYWPSGSNGVFSLVAYSPSSSRTSFVIDSGGDAYTYYVYFGFRVAE